MDVLIIRNGTRNEDKKEDQIFPILRVTCRNIEGIICVLSLPHSRRGLQGSHRETLTNSKVFNLVATSITC